MVHCVPAPGLDRAGLAAVRQQEVAVAGKLLADDDTGPRPRLIPESHLLPFTDAGHFRQLEFQLLVSFPKLSNFSQTVFNSAVELIFLGLGTTKLVLVAFPDLGCSLL